MEVLLLKIMKKLNLVLLFGSFLSITSVIAQQEPHFTQYFDNMLHVNPGYAGSNDALSLTALHREQWVGFAGRPRTSTFIIHSPLAKNIGGGFSFIHDEIGPLNQTMLSGDLSYTLRFKKSKGRLSFGVKGGVNIISINSGELQTVDASDPDLINNVRNRRLLNFGTGVYYHTPKWFIGVSSPKLLQNSYDGASTTIEQRHYFLIGGGVIKLNPSWKLRPTAHLKLTEGAPLSIDMSAAFIYLDKWWLGAMHRWQDSFGAFIQFQVQQQLRAGFAYDHTSTDISNYSSGTFEVMLNYDLKFKSSGVRSPRYF